MHSSRDVKVFPGCFTEEVAFELESSMQPTFRDYLLSAYYVSWTVTGVGNISTFLLVVCPMKGPWEFDGHGSR